MSGDDEQDTRSGIERLRYADVALEGTVVALEGQSGEIAIIKPSTIWFGTRLPQYRILHKTLCSMDLWKGRKVRALLRRIPEETGWLDWIRSIFVRPAPVFDTSSCSMFGYLMHRPDMRRAVRMEAARRR